MLCLSEISSFVFIAFKLSIFFVFVLRSFCDEQFVEAYERDKKSVHYLAGELYFPKKNDVHIIILASYYILLILFYLLIIGN